MTEPRPAFELPLLLLAGFRSLIDQLHRELARQGHPGARPAYGFTMQAIGCGGVTASELARRLGISKQAVGKTVERLEALGYVVRVGDERDGRSKLLRLTDSGTDMLRRSAVIFDELRAQWMERLGDERMAQFEAALRELAPSNELRLDVLGWFVR